MNFVELLFSLYRRGVRFWIDQGELHYRSWNGTLHSGEIRKLREHKNEIIARMNTVANYPAETPAPGFFSELAPLSFQQQMWWDDLQRFGNATEVLGTVALHISGELDLDVLVRSLREVVCRHDVLRTRFVVVEGVPLQLCSKPRSYPLDSLPIKVIPEQLTVEEARRLVEQQFNQRMNLETGPLVDVRAFKLAEGEHVLAVAIHPTLADELSFSILFRELLHLYTEFRSLKQPSLPPVDFQYADYAVWQRSACSQLFDAILTPTPSPPVVALQWPIDECAQGSERLKIAELTFSLEDSQTSAARAIARRERKMLSIVLLTAYAIIVSKWCNQCRLLIPLLVHGRDQSEFVEVMGFFSRHIYVRISLDGGEPFARALGAVAEEVIAAQKSGGPTKAVDEPMDVAIGPGFNWVMWPRCMSNGMPKVPEWNNLPSLKCDVFPVQPRVVIQDENYKLDLKMWDSDEGIAGQIHYRADLFKEETMRRLSGELGKLIEVAAEESQRSIAALFG